MAQQPGQVSPDGLWRWDGQRWVATGAGRPPAQPPAGRSLAWLWWLLGGCAVLLVVAIVAGIVGLAGVVRNFQSGGYSCLPGDFPAYPGATVVRENSTVGGHNECDMTLTTTDDVATVTRFYATQLNQGDWEDSVDTENGVVRFQQVSGGHATGQVELLGAGQHTEIRISVVT